MSEQWYYQFSGRKMGPFSGKDFRKLAAAGVLTPRTLVWKEGLDSWIPASRLKLVFAETQDPDPTDDDVQVHEDPESPGASPAPADRLVGPAAGRAASTEKGESKTSPSLMYALGSVLGSPRMQKLVLPITLLALAPIVAASWVGGNILLNYIGNSKQLAAVEDRKFQTKYSRLESNVYEHCDGFSDREGMYDALFDRANEEVKLANDAWRAFDDDRARWHAQRASDYKFAAQCYCETGKFPPGFDADLATK